MITTLLDNFYLTEEQLENSPSRKDGVDSETETALRLWGCEVIQCAVVLLEAPQVVAATAQVLLHRFLCKRSLKRFHIKKVAFACTWLACKLEEHIGKDQLNMINVVFERVYARRDGIALSIPDPGTANAIKWNTEINAVYELEMLKAAGFICHVDHPHKLVCNLIGFIFMRANAESDEESAPKELTQEAWNLANDSLRTTLCVRVRPVSVACGCIFLASRRLGIPMPEDPPWWSLFGVDKADIDKVCYEILKLYTLPPAQYISVNRDASKSAAQRIDSEPEGEKGVDVDSPAERVNGAALPPPPESKPSKAAELPPGFSQGSTAGGKKRPRDGDDQEQGRGASAKGPRSRDDRGRDSRERERDRDRDRERDRKGSRNRGEHRGHRDERNRARSKSIHTADSRGGRDRYDEDYDADRGRSHGRDRARRDEDDERAWSAPKARDSPSHTEPYELDGDRVRSRTAEEEEARGVRRETSDRDARRARFDRQDRGTEDDAPDQGGGSRRGRSSSTEPERRLKHSDSRGAFAPKWAGADMRGEGQGRFERNQERSARVSPDNDSAGNDANPGRSDARLPRPPSRAQPDQSTPDNALGQAPMNGADSRPGMQRQVDGGSAKDSRSNTPGRPGGDRRSPLPLPPPRRPSDSARQAADGRGGFDRERAAAERPPRDRDFLRKRSPPRDASRGPPKPNGTGDVDLEMLRAMVTKRHKPKRPEDDRP